MDERSETGTGTRIGADAIASWVAAVARRTVHDTDLDALRLQRQTSGPTGPRARLFTIAPHRNSRFEAMSWHTRIDDMHIAAYLCSPIDVQYIGPKAGLQRAIFFRVLSGAMHVEHDGAVQAMGPDSVGTILPGQEFRAQCRGMFAVVAVVIPVDPGEPETFTADPLRIHAAVDVARSCLGAIADGEVPTARDVRVIREILTRRSAITSKPPGAAPLAELRERARTVVEWEHTDQRLTVARIAEGLRISRRHLHRAFAEVDESLPDILLERRLRTAVKVIAGDTSTTMRVVAKRSGFASADQLRRAFQRHCGTNPSDIRAQYHTRVVEPTTGDVGTGPKTTDELGNRPVTDIEG